jgi:hypothetical protein
MKYVLIAWLLSFARLQRKSLWVGHEVDDEIDGLWIKWSWIGDLVDAVYYDMGTPLNE